MWSGCSFWLASPLHGRPLSLTLLDVSGSCVLGGDVGFAGGEGIGVGGRGGLPLEGVVTDD